MHAKAAKMAHPNRGPTTAGDGKLREESAPDDGHVQRIAGGAEEKEGLGMASA
jgi:hypothetical protein